MINPVVALLTAALAALGGGLLLWPSGGWLWTWLRAFRATQRVLIEDALKHLFDALQEKELVDLDRGDYRLTAAGREYALKIIRIHRLWERYLSDTTGLDPAAWHHEAELLEHTTSQAEAEALSASMGDPRYDPHGDPIPTAEGDIVPPTGLPLPSLAIGELAEIVHLEDEPEAVYAQLIAEDLHLGMRVRVNASTPTRIHFEADAAEHMLAPVLAANISVRPLPKEEEMSGPFERLSGLELGSEARVVALSPSLRGPERRRLLDLGLIPGTMVGAEIGSPAGDPTGYLVRGAVIALRRAQADHIQIDTSSRDGQRS
jgi:DtxR family Mn-dependent transcriptional regulator